MRSYAVTEGSWTSSPFMNPTLAIPAAGNLPEPMNSSAPARAGRDRTVIRITFKKSYGPRMVLPIRSGPIRWFGQDTESTTKPEDWAALGETTPPLHGSYHSPLGANQQTPEVLLDKITATRYLASIRRSVVDERAQRRRQLSPKQGRPGTTQT